MTDEERARELANLFWRLHPADTGGRTREEYYASHILAALASVRAEATLAEREACATWLDQQAEVCRDRYAGNPSSLKAPFYNYAGDEFERCGAAIRARTATPLLTMTSSEKLGADIRASIEPKLKTLREAVALSNARRARTATEGEGNEQR